MIPSATVSRSAGAGRFGTDGLMVYISPLSICPFSHVVRFGQSCLQFASISMASGLLYRTVVVSGTICMFFCPASHGSFTRLACHIHEENTGKRGHYPQATTPWRTL